MIVDRITDSSFSYTLRWTTCIQLISTPLSYSVTILVSWLTNPYIEPLLVFMYPLLCPSSIVIGFLVIPIILETGLWWHATRRIQQRTGTAGKTSSSATAPSVIFVVSSISNCCSYFAGASLGALVFNILVVYGLTYPIVELIPIALFFLVGSLFCFFLFQGETSKLMKPA